MDYSFDIKADRSGRVPWLKEYFTPKAVKDEDLLGYAGAEFEFATCPAYVRGVVNAARKGVFGYTMMGDAYKNAVKWWMKELRGYEVESDWIVPTQGTIFSVATSIRLLTEKGENIITMPPNYNRYEQAAKRLGRGCVRVPLIEENGRFRIDREGLRNAFANEKNRLLVICNPNNPTGNILSIDELSFIAELSKEYGVAVFSDEIFAEVVFEGNEAVPYTKAAGKDALAITCTSMGKVFSLTGVNHANVIIENDELRERYIAQRNADHFGSVDPMVYAGLLEAYSPEGRDFVLALKKYVWDNYLVLNKFFEKNLPKARLYRPGGTFVAWADYPGYGDEWKALDAQLREKGLFVGDEGDEYYGNNTCVRYSIAVPRPELEKTLDRVKTALDGAELFGK